jgi:hypothetical protein
MEFVISVSILVPKWAFGSRHFETSWTLPLLRMKLLRYFENVGKQISKQSASCRIVRLPLAHSCVDQRTNPAESWPVDGSVKSCLPLIFWYRISASNTGYSVLLGFMVFLRLFNQIILQFIFTPVLIHQSQSFWDQSLCNLCWWYIIVK